MSSQLSEILIKIPPSGQHGFEGLIAKLLESLTGHHFCLSKSGSQEGRDMSLRQEEANVIFVECKRYSEKTELDERNLLGELVQARNSTPDLDAWILVTSRSVDSKLYENLRKEAYKNGIEFEVIAEGDGTPSSLETLCANSPDIVSNFVKPLVSSNELSELNIFLEEIIKHPQFPTKTTKLKEKFFSPLIGHENWRVKQNNFLLKCLELESQSRDAFKQLINVQDDTRFIERKALTEQLDNWYMAWKSKKSIMAVLGEEGNGKTWGVARWLGRKVKQDSTFPPVIFLSSQNVRSTDDQEPEKLILRVVANQLKFSQTQIERWEKCLKRWIDKSNNNSPIFLLILDGINQHCDFDWWRSLLDSLNSPQWCENIAILTTCRKDYWDRNFANLRYFETVIYTLPPYSEDELEEALEYYELNRAALQDNLFPLISKPRFFDLMVKYRNRFINSGDVTVARLIYEDRKDQLERKSGLPLNDESFQGLIRDLAAKKLREPKKRITNFEIGESLLSHKTEILEELRTGGILKGSSNNFQVDEKFLTYGFGLLLVDQLKEEIEQTARSPEEIVAEWLEPHAAMDVKAAICHFASLIAIEDSNLSCEIKVTLLLAWVNCLNPGPEIDKEFIAYLPCDPALYIELAEVIWSNSSENAWAQELLMRAFIRWTVDEKNEDALKLLTLALRRWLSFLPLKGFPSQRSQSRQTSELSQEIDRKVNYNLQIGEFEFHGYCLIGIENDDLLRLGRVALGLISRLPRKSFIRAIAIGCLVEEIMDSPEKDDLFGWVIRTAPNPVWDAIEFEAGQLLAINNTAANQAAYRLLSYDGSQQAYQLQQTLPKGLFTRNAWMEEDLNDPCTSGLRWSQQECNICLQREDLTPHWIASRLQPICINPELDVPNNLAIRIKSLTAQVSPSQIWSSESNTSADILFKEYEPVLCAYTPQLVANLVKEAIQSIKERSGLSLRQLCFKVREHYLLLETEEKSSVFRAWQQFNQNIGTDGELETIAEADLFQIVLKGVEAKQQLFYLLGRPEMASDQLSFQQSFKRLQNSEIALSTLTETSNEKSWQRALWFLSTHDSNLHAYIVREYIYPIYCKSQDSLTRSTVLEILYQTNNIEAVKSFICSSWRWNPEYHDKENHWGSLLLGKYETSLPYSVLKQRLHPICLEFALSGRGMVSEEIQQFAEDIHQSWTCLSQQAPDLPIDFPFVEVQATIDDRFAYLGRLQLSKKNEVELHTFFSREATWGGWDQNNSTHLSSWDQLFKDLNTQNSTNNDRHRLVAEVIEEQFKAGNFYFCHKFSRNVIAKVVSLRPDLVNTWLNSILKKQDKASQKLIQLGSTFYEVLCSVLLDCSHPKAVKLYWYLHNIKRKVTLIDFNTDISFLDRALFEVSSHHSISLQRQRRLESCCSDLELMKLVIAIQQSKNSDWLGSYLEMKLKSPAPLDFSYAITILGFLETDSAYRQLNSLIDHQPDSWRKQLSNLSLECWQKNSWAKYWFKGFLQEGDNVIAWRNFRLFLRCVDRRFWLWQESLIQEIAPNENRLTFYHDNKDTIKNSIQKNEKELKQCFLGRKIAEHQVWPWL